MAFILEHPPAAQHRKEGAFTVELSVAGTTEDSQAQYINVAGVLRRGSGVICDFTSGAASAATLLLEENGVNAATGWLNLFFMSTSNGGYAGAGSVTADVKKFLVGAPYWIRLRLTAISSGIVRVHFTP